MANDKDGIVIEIDLDSSEYNKSLTTIDNETKKASKSIGDSLDKGISKSLTTLSDSVSGLNFRLAALSATLDVAMRGIISIAPVVFLVEQRFNILGNILSKFGLSLDNIVDRIIKLKNTMFGFAKGEKSVFDLKIAFGKLLEEVGLVDNSMLKMLNTVDNVGMQAKTMKETVNGITDRVNSFVSAIIQMVPIFILIESKTKIFSKTAAALGINVTEVRDSFKDLIETMLKVAVGEKGILSLKLAIGFLLKDLGIVDSRMLGIIETLGNFSFSIDNAIKGVSGFAATGALMYPIVKNFDDIKNTGKNLAKLFFGGKGFFGLTASLTSVSVALYGVAEAFDESENAMVRLGAEATRVTAVLIGGLAAAISYIIIQVSNIAHEIGNKLVVFFKKTAASFSHIERSLLLFEAAITATNRHVGSSIGTFEGWETAIGQVADKFNLVREDVRKAGQEIVLIGPKMGLVESQMRKLLVVSAEYAKINHKDVYETTIAMVNALSGNSQAVASLGIRLNAAVLQQQAYAEGITETVQSLNEGEKTQIRFNSIIEQYGHVAGLGALAADTLAEQNDKLKINQDRLNAALGEGARVIEQNNVAAFVYNKVLGLVGTEVTQTVGFLGALLGRFLQIGGALLGVAFKVYAVTKAFKLLEILISSELGIKAFAQNIPLINKSINALLSSATSMKVEIKSLNGLFKALGGTAKAQMAIVSNAVGGSGAKLKVVFASIAASLNGAKVALAGFFAFIAPLLAPFAVAVAILGAILGAVYSLKKGLQELEKQTGVFSAMWQVMVDIINSSGGVFQPMLDTFLNLGEIMKTLANKVFGTFVASLGVVMNVITRLVKSNPFGVFSDKTVASVKKIDGALDGFLRKMLEVDFDMRKLSNNVAKSLASIPEHAKVNFEKLGKFLDDVTERYKNFGLNQIQILQKQQRAELAMLNQSYSAKLVSEQRYLELKGILNKDYSDKLKEIVAQGTQSEREKIGSSYANGLQVLLQYLDAKLLTQQQFEDKSLQMTANYDKKIAELNDQATMSAEASFSNIAKAMKVYAKTLGKTAGEMAKIMTDLAVQGFSSAFESIGASFADAARAGQAFEDAMRKMFANMASAAGDYYIAKGIAISADPMTPGGGAGMIAGGAALKVLAGFLGSSSTTSATAGAGGGATTGAAGTQTQETALLTDAAAEKEEEGTGITVNIQGDILDGQETGSRIVDVLNDAFGKNGAILTNVRMA